MDLDFTEEQQLLRSTLRGMCEELVPPAVVRQMEHDARGYPEALWQALRDSGFLGLRIAESLGGVGLGALECVIAYEEFGRCLAPSPHFESSLLTARLVALAGTAEQQRQWLAAIAAGNLIVVPAWQEAGVSPDLARCTTSLVASDGGWRLQGAKVLIPHAASADRLLVVARHPEREGERVAVLVAPQAAGVTLRTQENHAQAALYAADFVDVDISAGDCLGLDAGKAFASQWDQALLEGLVALGALAVGGAERVLELTNAYARERKQFDRAIGSFQAIAHSLADRATELEGARILVYKAAWAIDAGQPFEHLALMAKLQAGAMFRRASATSVQVHGGIGFTLDADPQLYFRRAKHQQLMYGDPAWLEARIASCVIDNDCLALE